MSEDSAFYGHPSSVPEAIQLASLIVGKPLSRNFPIRDLDLYSIEELSAIEGIGEDAARKLKAAFELGRRLLDGSSG